MRAQNLGRAAVATLVLGSLGAFASCASKPTVDITLTDPCHLRSDDAECGGDAGLAPTEGEKALCGASFCSRQAEWAELAVFSGGCPSDAVLAAGDVSGASNVYSVPVGGDLPEPGDLSKETYGFAAYLRGEDCAVLGYGCTTADLSHVRSITIEIDPSSGEGACEAPLTCVQGVCAARPPEGGAPDAPGEGGGGDAGDGGTCSLSLVASGKLPDPTTQGAIASGPGIVAVKGGFVIGWREDEPLDAGATQGKARLVLLDPNGKLGTPSEQTIDACPGILPGGNVAMTMATSEGLLVLPQVDCNDAGAGASFVTFGPNGQVSNVGTAIGAGPDLTVARVHGAAPDQTGTSFEVVYTSSGVAYQVPVVDSTTVKPQGTFTPLFGGTSNTFGEMATTSDIVATLADSIGDAGAADGGDAGGAGSQMLFGVAGWDASVPTVTTRPGGSFAAVTAYGSRAIAVTPGATGGIAWIGRSADGKDTGSGQMPAGGPYLAADVTTIGDHAVIAAAQAKTITLVRVDGIGTTLVGQPAATQKLTQIGSVPMSAYDGKSIAIAASGTQVAVTWITTRQTSPTEPTGGFALFDCAN